MRGKKGSLELAVINGFVIALILIGGMVIYEKIEAKTPDGQDIKCEWNCPEWSLCNEGYNYRDTNLCVPKDVRCLDSEPKPPDTKMCD